MAKCNRLISKSNANEPYRIGELAADDFVRSKYPNATLLPPEDIETSGSKLGDFDIYILKRASLKVERHRAQNYKLQSLKLIPKD